jgi:serine/threonine-protein kinase RsbW
MMGERLEFELENDVAELDRLAEMLEEFGERIGLAPRCLFEMNLAIDELFTNIVSYGFTDDREHRIRVVLDSDGKQITVTIEDDGAPFNPLKARKPDLDVPLEETPVGGLGIHLCKNMMDNLSYNRSANKNVVTLRKRLNPVEPSSTGRK